MTDSFEGFASVESVLMTWISSFDCFEVKGVSSSSAAIESVSLDDFP